MCQEKPPERAIVDIDGLKPHFPTHNHDTAFWESLGRTVATFGFLEEVLGKAIFSFTATKPYPADTIDDELKKWLPKLERALSDPLGGLITSYEKAVKDHPDAADICNELDKLIPELRDASMFRNVLCHGSWSQPPDKNGAIIPLFVNREKMAFAYPINRQFLEKLQHQIALLSCNVINSVTSMGWQFPGSSSPGKPIFGD